VHDYEKWKDSLLGTRINGFDVLKRIVDILTDEIYLDDIRGALHWNEIAERIEALQPEMEKRKKLSPATAHKIENLCKTLRKVKKRPVPIFVIAPREWFGEENRSTEFSPSLIKKAIGHGQKVAADRKQWLWPPQ